MSELNELVDVAAARRRARHERSHDGRPIAKAVFVAMDQQWRDCWVELIGQSVRIVARNGSGWCRQRDHGWLPDADQEIRDGRLLEVVDVYEYYAGRNAVSEFRQDDALIVEVENGHRYLLPLAALNSDKSEVLDLEAIEV